MTERSPPTWSCPDADEHGFVSFEYLQRQAIEKGRERFLESFPTPALMVVYRGSTPTPQIFDPNQSGVQLLTMAVKSAAILRYLGRLAFVCKKPGNLYAHLVSIGRSAANDITIAVDSVSKVHGYFVLEDGLWHFTDHGSTNGSKINGQTIQSGEKHRLDDGAVLQLGLEVMLEYLSPAVLLRRITKSA